MLPINVLRFVRKCRTDPPAAWASACLVGRSLRGRVHWWLRPHVPVRYRLPEGGVLMLEPGHSFTHCFWPGVDSYEPDVRAALKHFLRPGDVFVDCGANVGYFSVLAGSLVGGAGQVVAIEANPITHRLLERNLSANGLGAAVQCALTARPGPVRLFVPCRGGDVYSCTRMGGLLSGEELDTFNVEGRTLDDVCVDQGLSRVDLVKIDIEGAELEVLRCAPRVLRELRPVVICEYGTNTWPAFEATPQALMTLLDEYGYRVGTFDTISGRVRDVTVRDWAAPYANLILQPKEHASTR